MDLHDYPRPKGDTGIGVHWSAGYPAVVGIGQIRDFWLPEIQAMGVKWVKLAQYDGGLELSELLLKHDIMPIVRLYRCSTQPRHPGWEGVGRGQRLRCGRRTLF